MRPDASGGTWRSFRANTVPSAMTNRLRSLARRTITSWASAPAQPGRSAPPFHSWNGITATDARRAGVLAWPGDSSTSCFRDECQALRMTPASSPSSSNRRAVAWRCSSPSRRRPLRASAPRRSSWARRSKGASSTHPSRYRNASSSGACVASRSSSATCAPWKRRRCPASHAAHAGLRSISRPSSSSPPNSASSAAALPGSSGSAPSFMARWISTASTKHPARSSRTASSWARRRCRPASSTTRRILLRHQRSSPRGSFGTSQRSSQSWLRGTSRGASAR